MLLGINIMIKKITILFLIFMLSGCATSGLKNYTHPEPLTMERIDPHELDTSQLDDEVINVVESIEGIPVSISGNEFYPTSQDQANYILLSNEEYSKIDELLSLTLGYKKIAEEQSELVNSYINYSNKLQELMEIERQQHIIRSESLVSVYELYETEHRQRINENIIHNVKFYSLLASGLILLIL